VILLISYAPRQDAGDRAYAVVCQTIEMHALGWRRPLFAGWFVETNELPIAWSKRLAEVADPDDSWFVVQIQAPYHGWLDRDVWDWLAIRL
jgi:hypothetical protein